LDPMVRVLQRQLQLPPPPGEALELEMLIAALRAVACTAPLQDGLRRCSVCGAAFATPLRMRDHLGGRRHCTAVAMQFSSEKGLSSSPIDREEASKIFESYSTVPLSRCRPEPPDVALVKLKNEGLLNREQQSGKRTGRELCQLRFCFGCQRSWCLGITGSYIGSQEGSGRDLF
ncbi:unnamed protein product, partial [Cladocopium goreaui]